MTLTTEEDLGVVTICEGDVFTRPLPRDFVVRQRLKFGASSWQMDESSDIFAPQHIEFPGSALEAELDAWQAARDEAILNMEASLSE
jgi:hypothetical protein